MSYMDSLAHFYDMSTPVGLPDLGVVGTNPGVGANIASNPNGVGGGRAAEFNGNNSLYNLGDIAELNSVTAFTIAFWMNQDVLDITDRIFQKEIDASSRVFIHTNANTRMYFEPLGNTGRGNFIYGTVINAGQWHHVAMVFDGSQTGDANRLMGYVDANPVVLAFDGSIPATTPDLSGIDAFIGTVSTSFDGKLDSFGIFSQPLTQLQVTDFMIRTRRGQL